MMDQQPEAPGLWQQELKAMQPWQTGKPPHGQVVEVEHEGRIIRVRAQWGRDGYRPHWESEDRDTHWSPAAFPRWRPCVGI